MLQQWVVMVLLATQAGGQFRGGAGPIRGSSGPSCPEKNGRFPIGSQCDAYLECEDGVGTEKLCPDGLVFNAKARHFAYPCQYPVDVDCEGRASLQPPQPTEDCPHQYGYFLIGDERNCGQFRNCVEGRGYTFDCPDGLAFNPKHLQCDWPDQVEACDAEAFLGFKCPEAQGVFADGYRFYRSPSDCQKYFICVEGRPRRHSCGSDEAFNEDIGTCDGIENVTSCARELQQRDSPVKLPRRF